MTKDEKIKSMILNKIISLNKDIDEGRFNENFAAKLNYWESAGVITKQNGLLIDFRNWLQELKVEEL
jgi:hypothetical protein